MKHHSNHRFLALREGPSEESLHERLKARPEKATPEVHLRIFDLRSMRQLNAANAILIDERADCRGPKRRHCYIASEIDFATARAELMNIWASGLGVRFFTVMTTSSVRSGVSGLSGPNGRRPSMRGRQFRYSTPFQSPICWPIVRLDAAPGAR